MSDTKKLTLARPWTTRDGKEHQTDDTVEVDAEEASELLFYGYAREEDKKATAKKEGA